MFWWMVIRWGIKWIQVSAKIVIRIQLQLPYQNLLSPFDDKNTHMMLELQVMLTECYFIKLLNPWEKVIFMAASRLTGSKVVASSVVWNHVSSKKDNSISSRFRGRPLTRCFYPHLYHKYIKIYGQFVR